MKQALRVLTIAALLFSCSSTEQETNTVFGHWRVCGFEPEIKVSEELLTEVEKLQRKARDIKWSLSESRNEICLMAAPQLTEQEKQLLVDHLKEEYSLLGMPEPTADDLFPEADCMVIEAIAEDYSQVRFIDNDESSFLILNGDTLEAYVQGSKDAVMKMVRPS